MKTRTLLASPTLWLASAALAVGAVLGCSSSSQTQGPSGGSGNCTAGSTVSCTCASGEQGTELCGEAPSACSCNATPSDGGAGEDAHLGDGGHLNDGSTPSSLYGACAVQGGFGWPCTQPNANDPTNCTDVDYPYCFGGGQGYWCTKACTAGNDADCTTGAGDAGCIPTACNARGYCK